jgi:hypothetical protein
MATLVLLLAVVLAGASFVFSNSGIAALGNPDWINNVCSSIPFLCNHPHQLGIAAAVLGALWLVVKFASVVRN